MFRGKDSIFVTVICAAGMGMFAALWLLDFALIRTDWCNGTNDSCFREWVSALSGWAAAFAAVLAVLPIYGQLQEQRRQTSFTLGDAKPTIDIERKAYLSLQIRIVNWNRRTLMLRPISYTIGGQRIHVRSASRKTETGLPATAGGFGFAIPGWEDRTQRPHFSELSIELDGKAIAPETYNDLATIEINGELVGENGGSFHEKITVSGWGKPRL